MERIRFRMTEEKPRINEKYLLTLAEARDYFGLGDRKLRTMSVEHEDLFPRNGSKIMVIREKLEEYIRKCRGSI